MLSAPTTRSTGCVMNGGPPKIERRDGGGEPRGNSSLQPGSLHENGAGGLFHALVVRGRPSGDREKTGGSRNTREIQGGGPAARNTAATARIDFPSRTGTICT